MEPKLTFDDIILEPRFSTLKSRSEANTSTKLGKLSLLTPIMSANMETVTGPEMCISMWQSGGVGVLHRFQSIYQNIQDYKSVVDKECDCVVSIGVSGDFKERAQKLWDTGARYFCIDIAHGHSLAMKETIEWLRKTFGEEMYIIAGNVATGYAAKDLCEWDADAIKVGVGPGSVCTTRVVTGHGVPQYSAIRDCAYWTDQMDKVLIADGGIRSSGDIVKAIVAGANMVMIGSLLAGAEEAPGDVVTLDNGEKRKTYMGSASYDRQGVTKEGIKTTVPYKGFTKDIIDSLTGGLRSGMSYSNARTLDELFSNARPKIQSMSAIFEGRPHIKDAK